MAISGNRMSLYTQASTTTESERPKSGDSAKKEMWSSMLEGVASGKRLPEKTLVVLGGAPESQKEFLDSLSPDAPTQRGQDRVTSKKPPVANSFALGYTYQDVLDTDHEDILARLSIYLLSDPSPSFTPLLRPLLTPASIPNTLIVILLDWATPWLWLRQLRDWIRLLRTLLVSLDADSKAKMEEVMLGWRDRGRGTANFDGQTGNTTAQGEISLPLGPGEWEEALGLPLCVVCQNSDQMETLERERAWKEEDFDFVLQFMRTVLLKHGASLIYTIPSVPSPLQTLLHSSLGIHSLLKKQPLKHNVIDRDKVFVPPNWDSWGKIRVLREGFDVEGVNQGWSVDIKDSVSESNDIVQSDSGDGEAGIEEGVGGSVAVYEETIHDPETDKLSAIPSGRNSNGRSESLEVRSEDPQRFLAAQLELLDRIRSGDGSRPGENGRGPGQATGNGEDDDQLVEEGRVSEHIGPVQFNMGGIQVDAGDMLRRLKDRQSHQTPDPDTPGVVSPDGKSQNEALASFFAGLMKRGGSAANSPKPAGA